MTTPLAPILIEHDSQMGVFEEAIQGAQIVAVDTESDSFFSYRESVCLLQISTEEKDFLLDPLSLKELGVVKELLENDRVLKIFHAAENDVILLRYHLSMKVVNIFDTLIAAQVVGSEQCSLAGLLNKYFGVVLSKKEQRSDWRRRPLTQSQIHYAALDTHYLHALREELIAGMVELGRMEEAEWDFRLLEEKNWSPRPFNENDFARIKGAKVLDPVAVSALREVYLARNKVAESTNTAPFRVLTDQTLLELARVRPNSMDQLGRVKNYPRRARTSFSREILAALKKAASMGPSQLPVPERGPSRPRMTSEETRVYDVLRRWRDKKAAERGVMTHRITKNDLLTSIVKAQPRTLKELRDVAGMDPWRTKEYGQEILKAMSNAG